MTVSASSPSAAESPSLSDAGDAPEPESDGAVPDAPAPDGRQLRRARNRDAVVEALLDIYQDGRLRPNAEEIAARSGLSPRSVFRYFEDVDDLIRAAITRQQARIIPLLPIDAGPEDPLEEKIEALVAQRFRVFTAAGNAAAVMRLRAPFEPIMGDTLNRHREFLRSQLSTLFAPELAELGDRAGAALAAADVASSFEARHLLVDDQGLTPDEARSVMEQSLRAVLRPAR
jgi:AcrR family transcriptional regulator